MLIKTEYKKKQYVNLKSKSIDHVYEGAEKPYI